MKKNLLLFLFLLCVAGIKAQNTCATAYTIQTKANWRGVDSFNVAERWHRFNGTDNVFSIKLFVKNLASGSYSVALFENNCSTLPAPIYTTTIVGDSIFIKTVTLPKTKSYVIKLRNNAIPTYEVYNLYAYSGVANVILAGCTGSNCGYPTTCNELVCNGGFECITTPITGQGEISTGNSVNWTGVNQASPDLFTSNSGFSTPLFGVPCNGFGTQPGHNASNSYAGLILYAGSQPFNEYIQTKLTAPLIANKSYLISFYVSRGDRSFLQANSISIFLTTTQNNISGFGVIGVPPVATVTNATLLNDFNGWQLVTFCYKPTVSGQQFLTIGSATGVQSNITTGVNTTCAQVAPANFANISYLFIDDVSVKLLDVNSAVYTACPNATVQLQGLTCIPNSTYSVNWSPSAGLNNSGIQNPIATITATNIYNTNLVVTSSNSQTCGATGQSTVSFNPLPIINVAASSVSICPGKSTTLTATGSSGTYTWLPSNSVGNSIIVSPTVNTTYTVFGTSINGCVGQATFNVIIIVSPTYILSASVNPTILCTNTSSTAILTGSSNDPATTYTWLPSGIAGAVQTITPTAYTVYTLNSTISGCVLTNTVSVSVQSACCTSTLPAFTSNYYTGGTFTGPMVINADITFGGTSNFPSLQNGEFLIAPNVQITVLGTVGDFYLKGAHLYSCRTEMWKGITLQNGSNIVAVSSSTTGNSNLIEDAITAINYTTVTNPPNIKYPIEISNTIFNKNYVAINISNATAVTLPLIFFKNNVVTCRQLTFTPTSWPNTSTSGLGLRTANNPTTGLVSPYNLQNAPVINLKTPYTMQSSRTGIQLTNVTMGIATNNSVCEVGITNQLGASDFNLFDLLMYGIDANNSNISSVNNVFQNTRRLLFCVGTKCYYDGGSAIRSIATFTLNTKLNLTAANGTGSLTPSLGNRFWNCHTGVEGFNVYQFNASYATFRSIQSTLSGTAVVAPGNTGIVLNTNRFYYYMTNNEFTNINNAINIPIKSAVYNVGGGNINGIYAANMVINTNTFAPQTNTATPIGNNYLNNAISISGSNSTPWAFGTGGAMFIQNNRLNRVYRGISLNGMRSFPCLISSNTATLVVDGLYNSSQYGINIVNTQGGVAVTTNTLTGANTTSTLGNLVFVGSNNGTNSPSITCNVLSNAYQGFVFDNGNTGTYWRGNTMQTHARGMALVNSATISAQGSSGSPQDNQWLGTWTGANNGTYVDGTSDAVNSKLWTKTTGAFAPPSAGFAFLGQSYAVSTNTPNTTGAFSCGGGGGGGSSSMMASSGAVVALNNSAPTSTSAVILNNDAKYIANTSRYRNNPAGNSNMATSSIGKFLQVEQAFYNGNISTANSLNVAISPTNTVEQNYKTYNSLYYNYANNSFSVNDSSSLYNLAALCPGTNGACVYQARALYNSIYNTVAVFNANCANVVSSSRLLNSTTSDKQVETTIANAFNVDLFPNPNNGNFTIVSKTEAEVLEIVVMDIAGKIILTKVVNTSNFISNLDINTNAGIYFITIKNSKNESTTKKLIINNN